MFNKYLFVLLISGVLLLSACSNENSEQKVEENLSDKTEDVVVGDDELTVLELSPIELERYAGFTKDLNLKHLEGLEPISVAKMYVQSVLDKKYEVQYALYTNREEAVQWSEEEDRSIPESDRGTIEQNKKLFNNIATGKFVQTSDYEGYIEYDSGEELKAFQTIKNEEGIWQVAFMPIQ